MGALKQPVVVVGIGEMGAVFARALLRAGHPVMPVTREVPAKEVARHVPEPAIALVATGEKALHPVLEELPESWRTRVGLLQNELLPRDWERHGLERPTVAAVWFEKKRGTPVRVVRPTVVAGPFAGELVRALEGIDIAAHEVDFGEPLTRALVLKNLYILTANVAGLEVGGTTGALWNEHGDLARAVASDVLDLQERLVGDELPRQELIAELGEAFEADPEHECTGRSAPARLERALARADEHGLQVPKLRAIRGAATSG
ncbi:MAG: hypothetical protein ACOCUS_07365 [Polyangiales bacterium]